MESDDDYILMEEETTSRKDAGDEEVSFMYFFIHSIHNLLLYHYCSTSLIINIFYIASFQDLSAEQKAVFARLNHVQREQHLTGTAAGSVTATDRLMKELKDIYRSDHFKNGEFLCMFLFLHVRFFKYFNLSFSF